MAETEESNDTSTLEEARKLLYKEGGDSTLERATLSVSGDPTLPHSWKDVSVGLATAKDGGKHVRFAGIFFGFASVFFIMSLAVAGYFFYFGGNTVSSSKISLTIDGPTTVAGGDTVPLQLTVINRNPVAIENAIVEVTFPPSTRDAEDTTQEYPRYIENLGRVESGATVTRSLRAVLFGGAGETVSLPVSLSYDTSGSNASFTKKSAYSLGISSTPLELSVGTLSETVAGKPLTLTVTVRSNATLPLENVVLSGTFPFGFSVTNSSMPLTGSSVLIGTMKPGESKTVTLTGVLDGQQSEQRVFHFNVGTASGPSDSTLAVTYMSQETAVSISAPFIVTTLSVNGSLAENAVITSGVNQNITVAYRNTLPTTVSSVTVEVAVSGAIVDYGSISASRGFYRSSDRTIVFSQDTDPALAKLAPGASGIGTFNFRTLSGVAGAPSVTFSVSVSGTRVGQTNVPEKVEASLTKTVKVLTAVVLSAQSLHSSGSIANGGPIPPTPDQKTTYSIVWSVQNQGSSIADGVVSATLPSYVSYTGKTAGSGAFSYDSAARRVTWRPGDIAQGTGAQGVFQVELTPSTSQLNRSPQLTSTASFTGFDRFAGVTVKDSVDAVTIETVGDPGYMRQFGTVQ